MYSFRSEPILWIHVAGLAAVPIFLELCLLGLAVGTPLLPVWVELFLIATIGVVPVLWMQLNRPFYVFAVLAIALKQEQLTKQQRQILSLINTRLNRILAVLSALFLIGVLWRLYYVAPLAATVAPFSSEWRGLGLLIAGLAFLASNLFLQIPVSVARVFVTSDAEFAATQPYPVEKIMPDFTILGLQVNQILPLLGDTAKTED